MQLIRIILKNDEQHILRTFLHEEILANYMDYFIILAKIKKDLKEGTI